MSELLSVREHKPPVEYWCHTQMKIENVNFTWTIDNFAFRPEEPGKFLSSSNFSTRPDGKVQWRLELYPKSNTEENKDYILVFLRLVSGNKCKVKSCKISIGNKEGEKTNTKMFSETRIFYGTGDRGSSIFINRKFLFEKASTLLPNDTLTIICEISIIADTVNVSCSSSAVTVKIPECQLLHDLASVLETEKFSDVILSVEGCIFKAHKAILAARSPVFAAMFEHNMEEQNSNRVEIMDVDQDIMQNVLKYIYTGMVNDIEKIADKLLRVADKYALERLKVQCEEVLCKNLSLENVVEVLIMADLHSAIQLKARAINFIKIHAAEVTNTANWKSMMKSRPDLSNECLQEFLKNIIFAKPQ